MHELLDDGYEEILRQYQAQREEERDTRTLYSTPGEIIEYVVIPYLGDFVEDYDLDAIEDEIVEWVQEFNEYGIQLGNTQYRIKELTEDEFNAVLMRHDTSSR